MTILTLRNVGKTFASPDNGLDQVRAIDNVSLEVHGGEFFSIIGSLSRWSQDGSVYF
jgi:ABC-type oligopeptide transport system ATPase subunit